MNVYKKTAENHAWRAVRDNFLPRAMDKDDCYQEAMLYMLEHQEKPKEYIEAVLPFHLRLVAAKLWVGPSPQMRHYYRKTGKSVNFGESSLEDFSVDSSSWEDWLDLKQTEIEDVFSDDALPLSMVIEVIEEIKLQQKIPNDCGISYAKTRKKWHLECKVQKHTQFIGQYKTIEEARLAKYEFLQRLMDLILNY